MKTYSITSTRFEGELLLKYHSNGFLIGLDVNGDLTPNQLSFLYSHLPYKLEALHNFVAGPHSTMKAVLIPEDLSFDRFWNHYQYKVGKVEAEKAWQKLSDSDKHKALQRITSYNDFLNRKGTSKVWPERYIKKRYFDNNYAAV